MANSTTIDVEEEAREIREEKLPAVEEAQEELISELKEEYGDYSSVPAEEEAAFEKLEEKRVELEGRADVLERTVEEYNGGEYVIRELTTGALAAIQDEVSEASFEFDPETQQVEGGTPKSGYGMVETLSRSIVQQPDGAPTRTGPKGAEQPDPREYPHQLGLFLFDKVNAFNTVGEADMGNSSLRERMKR